MGSPCWYAGWPYFRGAVTLYRAITGIVYALLLSEVDVQLSSLLALAVMWIGRQRWRLSRGRRRPGRCRSGPGSSVPSTTRPSGVGVRPAAPRTA